jgi:predicted ATPase/class 3 adenylate cyclase
MSGYLRYQFGEVLHEGQRSRICRGKCLETGRAVVLKIVALREHGPNAVSQLMHEYQILERLRPRIGEVPVLTKLGDADVLVRTDKGGEPLSHLLRGGALSPPVALRIAAAITKSLDVIHRAGVIHKDINPSNILWRPEAGDAELIDFGIAEYDCRGEIPLVGARVVAGTWSYAAPEQSGRMRRTTDERADLYALGVTFYQLFSGTIPFVTNDVAELIHAHLAVKPMPLCERLPGFARVISHIVDKLLEKAPEHRYQTASGLLADLDRCFRNLGPTGAGSIPEFKLGSEDSIERFDIPERLYGRESEMKVLVGAFDEVRSGITRIVSIAGYSGIGKSSLVNRLQHSIILHRCNFLTGKFDQLQRHVPYATFVQAFQGLIRLTLREHQQRIDALRKQLHAALGENLRVLVEVIPELELIVGKQPAAEPLPPAELQHRLRLVLLNFIKVFATPDHPLVLFLDDLQWADSASVEMLEAFAASDEITHFMLIVAFRDNEVSDTHPVHMAGRRLDEKGIQIVRLVLGPIPLASIELFLADTLRTGAREVCELARICNRKTAGNPFFLIEFLRSMHRQGFIAFNKESGSWGWLEEVIRSQRVQENVVDLMVRRIGDLPRETQEVLKIGACMGAQFDLDIIAGIRGAQVEDMLGDAWAAVKQMLIVPFTPSQIHEGQIMGVAGGAPPRQFQFIHDRVQQAAYSFNSDQEKPGVHLRIARILLRAADERELNERPFNIVHHFNLAHALLTDPVERRRIAALNVCASAKARASAAYDSARGLADAALALLKDADWQEDYSLMFQAHCLAAESAYLCHDFAAMERLAETASTHARNVLDHARLAEVRIQSLMARGEPVTAIKLALPILRELGVKLTANPSSLDVMIGMANTEIRLRRHRRVEDLLDLPMMTDPSKLAAVRILEHVYSSAYFSLPKLYPLIMFTFIRLSLKYGNTAASAVGYSAYGVVLCGLMRDIERGNRFGQLSLNLVRRLAAKSVKAKVIHVAEGFVTVWKKHAEKVLPSFHEGYQAGLETGDLEFGCYTCHFLGFLNLWMGTPLETVDAEMRKWTRVIVKHAQSTPLIQQNLWHQFAANLLGQAANPVLMAGEHYEEEKMLSVHLEARDEIAQFFLHYCKVTLALVFHDSSEALPSIDRGLALLKNGAALGSVNVPTFFGYSLLVLLATARRREGMERFTLIKKARSLLKPVAQWARACEMLCGSRHLLCRAEFAALEGEEGEALKFYSAAIEMAKNHRNHLDLAIIHERCASFCAGIGQSSFAQMMQVEALNDYQRLQAHGVVRRMIRDHPELHVAANPQQGVQGQAALRPATQRALLTSMQGSSVLDVMTLAKSTRALSGEILLDRLLTKLMEIMLENAGADCGLLALVDDEGELAVEAQATINPRVVHTLQSLPINSPAVAPVSIFNYVRRTGEPLVLDDATQSDLFADDPFVQKESPLSIICVPLQHQGRLTGILYLHNRLTSHAFPRDRVFLLEALSAQAAISIENARLYSNLEGLNRSYARFVPHEFLDMLGKRSITNVEPGDQVQCRMSVLFSDIKGFTRLSETMSPEQNIAFINDYLRQMEPALHRHGGFIDKYIGDAIMALFPVSSADAVRAALAMLRELDHFNERHCAAGYSPLQISIGLNTGPVMLGVVGGARLDTTVISDTVNLASRVEHLTRDYQVSLLITENTLQLLPADDPDFACIRRIDCVVPIGKSTPVSIYEVFAADAEEVRAAKLTSLADFNAACNAYHEDDLDFARPAFAKLHADCPQDRVAEYYVHRCRKTTPPLSTSHLSVMNTSPS